MKVLVIACLIALCNAQPTPTEISETFTSKLSISRTKGEKTTTGTGAWDRNAEEMEFVFMDSFKSATGGEEKFEMLGLYAKKMRYSITTRGNGTSHCRPEKIPANSTFPKVWDWLKSPKTTKEEKTVNGTSYTVYTGHEGDETITLTVKTTEPTVPVMETRDGREGKEETRYETFEPTAPDSAVFEVPKSCKTPPRKRN